MLGKYKDYRLNINLPLAIVDKHIKMMEDINHNSSIHSIVTRSTSTISLYQYLFSITFKQLHFNENTSDSDSQK